MQLFKKSPNENLNIKFLFGLFVFIMILVISLRLIVLEFYRIPSRSMVPVLIPDDIVLVSKLYYFIGLPSYISNHKYWYKQPKRKDIIAFMQDGNYLVKRIWAVPGEEILINKHKIILPHSGKKIPLNFKNLNLYRDLIIKEGNTVMNDKDDVFINGIKSNDYTFLYNHYYVLGDNLSESIDSRSFGTITSNQIIGVPIVKIFGNNSPALLTYD